MQSDERIIKLIGQLHQVTTRKDGGSRIVIDCGYESLQSIQELIKLNGEGETNLAVAIVPYING